MNVKTFQFALNEVDGRYLEQYRKQRERAQEGAARRSIPARALALAACVALAVLLGLQPMVRYFSRNNGVGILPGESGAEQETQAETENGGNPYVPFAITSLSEPLSEDHHQGPRASLVLVVNSFSFFHDVSDVVLDARVGDIVQRRIDSTKNDASSYHFFVAEMQAGIFVKIEPDSRLIINGVFGQEYKKQLSEEEIRSLGEMDRDENGLFWDGKDTARLPQEIVNLNFEKIEDGVSGAIGMQFVWKGDPSKSKRGHSVEELLFYYKGAEGVGLSFVNEEGAIANYNTAIAEEKSTLEQDDSDFCCKIQPFYLTTNEPFKEVYHHGDTTCGSYQLKQGINEKTIKVNISASEGAEISAGYALV